MPKSVDVAIIGGGFTGASLALHLGCYAERPIHVAVFEPRGRLGFGVAYGTKNSLHRINVPAEKMNIFSNSPDDFLIWARDETDVVKKDPESITSDGLIYPRRRDFGHYVEQRLLDMAQNKLSLDIISSPAVTVQPNFKNLLVKASNYLSLSARKVVLCNSYGRPSISWKLDHEAQLLNRFVIDPWQEDVLDNVSKTDHVFIVGTGLTMADTVVHLLEKGHQGRITAISRRGLLPQPHSRFTSVPCFLEKGERIPDTPLMLMKLIHNHLDQAQQSGLPWQMIIESVRDALPQIWPHWSMASRRQALHHLRPYWDTRRYRLSPQVHSVLEAARSSGQLNIRRGRIVHIGKTTGFDSYQIKTLEQCKEKVFNADFIVNCIGPTSDIRKMADPLFDNLLAQGIITPDSLGLGIVVDNYCRALTSDGSVNESIYVSGPLTRSRFCEMVGVPEIASQTQFLARHLHSELSSCYL